MGHIVYGAEEELWCEIIIKWFNCIKAGSVPVSTSTNKWGNIFLCLEPNDIQIKATIFDTRAVHRIIVMSVDYG